MTQIPLEEVLSLPLARKFIGDVQEQEIHRLVLWKAPSPENQEITVWHWARLMPKGLRDHLT